MIDARSDSKELNSARPSPVVAAPSPGVHVLWLKFRACSIPLLHDGLRVPEVLMWCDQLIYTVHPLTICGLCRNSTIIALDLKACQLFSYVHLSLWTFSLRTPYIAWRFPLWAFAECYNLWLFALFGFIHYIWAPTCSFEFCYGV
jgi:hypothetical protein